MSSSSIATVAAASTTSLTRNQMRGFWAAWGGWALDGMDSFIYALVLVPALTELLPRSGIPATRATSAIYGSVLFALFLIGWGLSMLWGPIADRFGRVRTLMLTILCYSLFTLLCGAGHEHLAAGGAAGCSPASASAASGRSAAPSWPRNGPRIGARPAPATCTPATTSASSSPRSPTTSSARTYGWRWMFVFGGLPALLVGFIRYGVSESARWEERVAEGKATRGRR